MSADSCTGTPSRCARRSSPSVRRTLPRSNAPRAAAARQQAWSTRQTQQCGASFRRLLRFIVELEVFVIRAAIRCLDDVVVRILVAAPVADAQALVLVGDLCIQRSEEHTS